ncbi:MAG: hypothetical protein WC700_18510 [Gemmatimonadaceae bacterium]|jgi:hypothetical protein
MVASGYNNSEIKYEINQQFAAEAFRLTAENPGASVLVLDEEDMCTTAACVRAGVRPEQITVVEQNENVHDRQRLRVAEWDRRPRLVRGDAFAELRAPVAAFLDLTAPKIDDENLAALVGWARRGGRVCYITLASRYRGARTYESRTAALARGLRPHGLFLHEAVGYSSTGMPMLLLVFRDAPVDPADVKYRPRDIVARPAAGVGVLWYGLSEAVTHDSDVVAAALRALNGGGPRGLLGRRLVRVGAWRRISKKKK